MAEEDDTTKAAADQENADFAAGFDDKPASSKAAEKAQAKADKPVATPQEDSEPPVQISRKEWDEVRAAAQRTASYDSQLSRAFGTIGKLKENLQKLLDGQAATATPPAATRKVEIPKAAFEAMAKDFPELAEHNRAALEAALSGLKLEGDGTDESKLEKALTGLLAKKEMEGLEDTYPDWRTIVGAVDVTKTQPDPNNEFRKWLGTKDPEYQQRINETESAAVIQRSIALFRRETRVAQKPTAKPVAQPQARADRFRAAVQPKGDGAAAPSSSNTEEEAFQAGFASR